MNRDTDLTPFHKYNLLAILAHQTQEQTSRLPSDMLTGLGSLIHSFRKETGGYAGRLGPADIYYTGFAVRALFALGLLNEENGPVQEYFSNQKSTDIIETLSIAGSLMLLGVQEYDAKGMSSFLESFRTADGGYGKRTGSVEGSTYHSFLAVICYGLFNTLPPDPEGLRKFTASRHREDGGFSDNSDSDISNTNAAAAGVFLALLLEHPDQELAVTAREYILSMQTVSGGWLAGARAPVPDLLSTSSALTALKTLNPMDNSMDKDAVSFILSCYNPSGGFKAGPWDTEADVEYTYYGLSALGLCEKVESYLL